MARMNNRKLKILERTYTRPGLAIGGLADSIGRGPRTEQEVRYLIDKGYLRDDDRGLELSSPRANIQQHSDLTRLEPERRLSDTVRPYSVHPAKGTC